MITAQDEIYICWSLVNQVDMRRVNMAELEPVLRELRELEAKPQPSILALQDLQRKIWKLPSLCRRA